MDFQGGVSKQPHEYAKYEFSRGVQYFTRAVSYPFQNGSEPRIPVGLLILVMRKSFSLHLKNGGNLPPISGQNGRIFFQMAKAKNGESDI